MSKKTGTKFSIISGVICVLFVGISSWYTIVFNDSRFIVPMDLSEYSFRRRDLPIIVSGIFLAAYILHLFILLMRAVIKNKRREAEAHTTRNISPKLGFLGFLGFVGFLGFWTYGTDKTIFPFTFFIFFGFFGFFYEGKMSNVFMDERYRENKMKARMTADKTALTIIFLAVLILGQGKFMGNLEYALIGFVIIVTCAVALGLFLGEYLLYRYDQAEQFDESGE